MAKKKTRPTGYHFRRKVELIKFAHDRKVVVVSSSQDQIKAPHHRDYARALEQADRDATLRFLDLPPELRNRVYTNLLTLENSFTCHPAILRTSRQLNREASSILYGNNWLTVSIETSGVWVHGEQCGRQKLATFSGPFGPYQGPDSAATTWPGFLRRAQAIRIQAPTWHYAGVPLDSTDDNVMEWRDVCIGNILHSLCSFLGPRTPLRWMQLDLNLWPESRLQNHQLVLYSIRMLGNINVHIKDGQDRRLEDFDPPAALPGLLSGATLALLKTIHQCNDIRSRMPPSRTPLFGRRVATFFDTVQVVAMWAEPRSSSDSTSFSRLVESLRLAVKKLRVQLEDVAIDVDSGGEEDAVLYYRFHEMLRLEVDLMAAL